MKYKLTILLDYDDTARLLNKDGVYIYHNRLNELINKFSVSIYSGNPEAIELAQKYNIPFIFKGDDLIPCADVLIDDMKDELIIGGFTNYFKVDHIFSSINNFFSWIESKKN